MNTPLFQQKARSASQQIKEDRERKTAIATNLGKKLNALGGIRTGQKCCGGSCPSSTAPTSSNK